MTGRRCDTPESGHFVPFLDFRTYEAEEARITQGAPLVTPRQPFGDRILTWSGTGFMRLPPQSSIEFVIDNIPRSKLYDVVVRYEPQVTGRWNVQLSVKRPIGINPLSECANYTKNSDIKQLSLSSSERHIVVDSICLEENTRYIIQLEINEFERPSLEGEAPSILIDSVCCMFNIK